MAEPEKRPAIYDGPSDGAAGWGDGKGITQMTAEADAKKREATERRIAEDQARFWEIFGQPSSPETDAQFEQFMQGKSAASLRLNPEERKLATERLKRIRTSGDKKPGKISKVFDAVVNPFLN